MWLRADRAVDALSPAQLQQRGERGLLFATDSGKPLTQAAVFAIVRRLARADGTVESLGLPGLILGCEPDPGYVTSASCCARATG